MITIEKFSHFIRIRTLNYEISNLLTRFASNYVTRSFVKEPGMGQVLKPTHVYAARTKDKTEYRFHVNQLNDLLKFLTIHRIDVSYITIEEKSFVEPEPITATVKPSFILRDYQEEASCYINIPCPLHTKLIAFQTGQGKTITSIVGLVRKGQRVFVIILPQYIGKWVNDLTSTLNIRRDGIMTVQGSNQLKALIEIVKEDRLVADFVIISSKTYQNYIMEYEEQDFFSYDLPPDELFPLAKVGSVLIDETHQHLHVMFKLMLYTHVDLLLGLTATLITDSYEVEQIHRIMYPPSIRFNNIELDKYADVLALSYSTTDFRNSKLRTTEWGQNTYSHNAYENSILKNKKHLENYLNIIDYCVGYGFIDHRQPNDKLAIYAATTDMCDAIVKFLRRKYGHRYSIERFCKTLGDPDSHAYDPDIRVTTPNSMGTAFDVKGLRVVLMTNSITSPQANIQILGRLRKLTDRNVLFMYIYNDDIRKQVDYHKKKRELFKERVKTHKELRLPIGM